MLTSRWRSRRLCPVNGSACEKCQLDRRNQGKRSRQKVEAEGQGRRPRQKVKAEGQGKGHAGPGGCRLTGTEAITVTVTSVSSSAEPPTRTCGRRPSTRPLVPGPDRRPGRRRLGLVHCAVFEQWGRTPARGGGGLHSSSPRNSSTGWLPRGHRPLPDRGGLSGSSPPSENAEASRGPDSCRPASARTG